MPLAAAALLPSLVTQLNDIGGNIPAMTLADLITSEIAGYDLSMPAPKSPMLDFRWPRPIAAALASDCNRFSCAAFQSVAEVSSEMEKR